MFNSLLINYAQNVMRTRLLIEDECIAMYNVIKTNAVGTMLCQQLRILNELLLHIISYFSAYTDITLHDLQIY